MNAIVNKLLSAGDKLMPEMHLKQLGFTYNTCGPFTKNKERIKKLKEKGDSRYIYQNEVNKACYQHDIAYGDFKDLSRSTIADKVLHDKAFYVAKIPNVMDINVDLLQWFINFLIKKLQVVLLKKTIQNEELAEVLLETKLLQTNY